MFNLMLSKMLRFLADTITEVELDPIGYNETWWSQTLAPIAELVGEIMVPMLILIGSVGAIYAIVLGVQYSKAESADKREETKKRMVNALIGIIVLIVLMVVLLLFCKYVNEIGRWVTNIINKTNGN